MFNSIVFPHVAPVDRHLVTVCFGGAGNKRILAEDGSALSHLGTLALKTELGATESIPLSLQRWELTIPQYDAHHAEIERTYRALESAHPGLYFIGADTGSVGVPNRIERAGSIADVIGAALENVPCEPPLYNGLP